MPWNLDNIWNRLRGDEDCAWSVVDLPAETTGETDTRFGVHSSYLSLSISAMKLVNRREMLRDYVPFVAFAIEIPGSEDKPQSLPILFDPRKKLQAMLDMEDPPNAIPIDGVCILSRFPVTFDRFNILGGLFRRKKGDLGDVLMDMIERLSTSPMVGSVAGLLEPARVAYDGLYRILSVSDVEMQAGAYRGFRIQNTEIGAHVPDADVRSRPRLLAPGAVAFISSGGFTSADLQIRKASLQVSDDDAEKTARLDASDSLVIDFEATKRRGKYDDLPSHRIWLEIVELLHHDKEEEAEKLHWPELGKSITTSPALVEAEKSELLKFYVAKLHDTMATTRNFRDGFGKARQARRGSGRPNASAKIRQAALKIEKHADNGKEIAQELEALAGVVDRDALEFKRVLDKTDSGPSVTQLEVISRAATSRAKSEDLFKHLMDTIFKR